MYVPVEPRYVEKFSAPFPPIPVLKLATNTSVPLPHWPCGTSRHREIRRKRVPREINVARRVARHVVPDLAV